MLAKARCIDERKLARARLRWPTLRLPEGQRTIGARVDDWGLRCHISSATRKWIRRSLLHMLWPNPSTKMVAIPRSVLPAQPSVIENACCLFLKFVDTPGFRQHGASTTPSHLYLFDPKVRVGYQIRHRVGYQVRHR